MADEKNPDYVARGLKAAIHNPNVSQEAKAHAAKQLKEMGLSGDDVQQQMSEDEHRRHQLGKNPEHNSFRGSRELTCLPLSSWL